MVWLRFLALCSVLFIIGSVRADPPRIGAIASLSGMAAEQGKNWLEGARLAQADLRNEGYIADLIVEDDATNPAKVHSAFRKLVAIDKVQGIIGGIFFWLKPRRHSLNSIACPL